MNACKNGYERVEHHFGTSKCTKVKEIPGLLFLITHLTLSYNKLKTDLIAITIMN